MNKGIIISVSWVMEQIIRSRENRDKIE